MKYRIRHNERPYLNIIAPTHTKMIQHHIYIRSTDQFKQVGVREKYDVFYAVKFTRRVQSECTVTLCPPPPQVYCVQNPLD